MEISAVSVIWFLSLWDSDFSQDRTHGILFDILFYIEMQVEGYFQQGDYRGALKHVLKDNLQQIEAGRQFPINLLYFYEQNLDGTFIFLTLSAWNYNGNYGKTIAKYEGIFASSSVARSVKTDRIAHLLIAFEALVAYGNAQKYAQVLEIYEKFKVDFEKFSLGQLETNSIISILDVCETAKKMRGRGLEGIFHVEIVFQVIRAVAALHNRNTNPSDVDLQSKNLDWHTSKYLRDTWTLFTDYWYGAAGMVVDNSAGAMQEKNRASLSGRRHCANCQQHKNGICIHHEQEFLHAIVALARAVLASRRKSESNVENINFFFEVREMLSSIRVDWSTPPSGVPGSGEWAGEDWEKMEEQREQELGVGNSESSPRLALRLRNCLHMGGEAMFVQDVFLVIESLMRDVQANIVKDWEAHALTILRSRLVRLDEEFIRLQGESKKLKVTTY